MKRRTLLMAAATPLLLAKPTTKLQVEFARIAAKAKGRVGVAVRLLGKPGVMGLGPSGQHPMQSVYKLPISMAMFAAIDKGAFALEQPILVEPEDLVGPKLHSPLRDKNPKGNVEVPLQEILRLAVSESDGTASDVLLRLLGGPQTVMSYLNGLAIKNIQVLNSEKELSSAHDVQYRNWATPAATLQLLASLHEGTAISKASRESLQIMMVEGPTGAKRLKGLLPPGTAVAHKTGTSLTVNGITAATNDVGIIPLGNGRAMAMAVYVTDSPASQEVREAVIAELAQAAWSHFGGKA